VKTVTYNEASVKHTAQQIAPWGMMALATLLMGCSTLEAEKIEYKSASAAPSLAIPPDLTQLTQKPLYVTPGKSATATGTAQQQQIANQNVNERVAPASLGDIRIERQGPDRWLVVSRTPEQLWPSIKDFWTEIGLSLVVDSPELGIFETEWSENRAKLPQDFIRKSIGKVFDSLYSTGERDKFRMRLERTSNGVTEIYLSHKGMQEVYSDSQKTQTVWQPRANDPHLENEILRRLMLKLGASPASAKQIESSPSAVAVSPNNYRLIPGTSTTAPTLELYENLDRSWRKIGLALDRTGFTVEDRDRSNGIYFVRYVPQNAPKTEEPGFFARMFGKTAELNQPQKFKISLRAQNNAVLVNVLNSQGQAETSAHAEQILKILSNDLN
jgi:outer membrane protein assembly factor BamC